MSELRFSGVFLRARLFCSYGADVSSRHFTALWDRSFTQPEEEAAEAAPTAKQDDDDGDDDHVRFFVEIVHDEFGRCNPNFD